MDWDWDLTRTLKECQSIRRAPIEVVGPDGNPLNLRKLSAEFDTGADDCMMTQSCYLQLKEFLEFKRGEADVEGVTEGETRMTQYVELNLNIGSINFPPGIKFWVYGASPKDAGFDVLLSGPFLAHHNVICIDPKLQREIEKDGINVEFKIQRHLDFLGIGIPRPLNEKGASGCIFQTSRCLGQIRLTRLLTEAKGKSRWN